MLREQRAKLASKSFDYQWRSMPEGAGLLSDQRFGSQVDTILSESELQIGRDWFRGRRVLDAGSGNGRWIEGFLRLGSDVTAMDVSDAALAHVRAAYGDKITSRQGSVLEADQIFAGERFDLVFSWGVLHHTASVGGGMKALAKLVKDDGLLYVYLYGKESVTRRQEFQISVARIGFNLMPLRARRAVMERIWGKDQAHAKFDLLSTPLNQRLTLSEATDLLHQAGMSRVTQTLKDTELFLRADRGESSADPYYLPSPSRPFWFETLAASP
jgi:SAM-dependent methyltransferase